VFESFEESALPGRLRALALGVLAAYLAAQAYFTAIPLLSSVPRWLFEGVRLILLAGAAAGLLGGAALCWRHRRALGWDAAGWLLALAAGTGLCAWTWAGMSLPPFL
jgi:hypothetical protein